MIECGEHNVKVLPYTDSTIPFIRGSAQVQIERIGEEWDNYFFDIYDVNQLDDLIDALKEIKHSFPL